MLVQQINWGMFMTIKFYDNDCNKLGIENINWVIPHFY